MKQAPLYSSAFDLSCWLLKKVNARPSNWPGAFADEISALASALTTEVSLALTFPRERPEHQRRIDEIVVALRIRLRLAREVGWMSPGALRHAAAELRTIGRMLGGWRRQTSKRTDKTTK